VWFVCVCVFCAADHCQVPWWDSKHLPDWLVAVAAAVIGSLVGVAVGFLIYNFCCRRSVALLPALHFSRLTSRPPFIPGIFWAKNLNPPPPKTAVKIVRSKSFFSARTTNYVYIRKLFFIKQSKGCRFMPKMHQNTFGGKGRVRREGAYL